MSYKGYKILAVIPARGGSKGIPRKNLCKIAGTSLVGHAVNVARSLDWIDQTVQRWLVENLYSSVRLLEELQDTNNTLVERKITTASYEIKYNQNDMLFNEVIEVKLPTHSTLTL